MNLVEWEKHISRSLLSIYEMGEAEVISDWVMENLSGKKRAARMARMDEVLTREQEQHLEGILERLMKHEPIQFVLNESWFMGCRFYVDQRVLIPRPETEELVEWVISHCKFPLDELDIIDIGTGSGCIPVSLKRRLRKARVFALDASEGALSVARKNADTLGTELIFFHLDFLDKTHWGALPKVDLLISNPPYIPQIQASTLSPHVVKYEPSMALFVPDNDALVFYRALAEFGRQKLKKGGQVFVEIHEDLSEPVAALFRSWGYDTEAKKDMQGKQRMVRAFISNESLTE